MQDWGFVRVTAASHPVCVADPNANGDNVIAALKMHSDSSVVVFGELSLCGYSCGDLFAQDVLLQSSLRALNRIAQATGTTDQLVLVGLPLAVEGRLYNVAAALHAGCVVALVPKQYLPNYQEFYEARWFTAADSNLPSHVQLEGHGLVPFGIDLLIRRGGLKIGIELCEDLWMPVPPSSLQATAGANLILNLSASNELIGKADWRKVLVTSQSGRCLAAYAYASAGPSESTTDVVFGGHCLIAEGGRLLAESKRVGNSDNRPVQQTQATADIDLQRIEHDRRLTTSWQVACQRSRTVFRTIELPSSKSTADGGLRHVSGRPFVPEDPATLHGRCEEIFGIQCAALAKRIGRLPAHTPLSIGVSGGLDSTLALLVAVRTCQQYDWPVQRIVGLTMPGFGTTAKTLGVAQALMKHLSVTSQTIDIRQLCLDTFLGIDHAPFGIPLAGLDMSEFEKRLQSLPTDARNDLTFENVQARVRTLLLMSRGFVLGTGDLSEQALGWSTYNGDHMSMYNVNTSIPKTLVRFLISYLAEHQFQSPVRECLQQVVAAPISPELLPKSASGEVLQRTEDSIGPYELHDFFLYHLIRGGASPKKILHLAAGAQFSRHYEADEVRRTLSIFLKRFFSNQFKRSCVPDGPKVGSVSLSPRGDWRMPSDADVAAWLADWDSL
ncbi:MAG: NAD(+) synthase [Pirellulaceae bacterium]|nr:NAD(+) synthase [Pirellulaceae bacterium]